LWQVALKLELQAGLQGPQSQEVQLWQTGVPVLGSQVLERQGLVSLVPVGQELGSQEPAVRERGSLERGTRELESQELAVQV